MCRPLSSEFGYFGNTNQGYQQTKQAYGKRRKHQKILQRSFRYFKSIKKYRKDQYFLSLVTKPTYVNRRKYRKDINFFF